MSELDLLKRSSFTWCDLFGDDATLLANGFNAWAGVFGLDGRWQAVGARTKAPPHLLSVGECLTCLAAADDFLNGHETDESAHKSRRSLSQPPLPTGTHLKMSSMLNMSSKLPQRQC